MKVNLINFVRESQTNRTSATEQINGEEISKFYEDLVFNQPQQNRDQRPSHPNECKRKSTRRRSRTEALCPLKQVTTDQFFKYCEIGNVSGILKSIDSGMCVNVQDMFGWTALMGSVCHRQISSVTTLIKHGASLDVKNKKGESVFDIAEQKRFLPKLLEILQSLTKTEPANCESDEAGTSGDFPGHCDKCNIDTNEMRRHCATINHLMSKPHVFPKVASFALGPKHIGYQMMQKSGWSGDTGLGAGETGRLYPIKTTMKKDRMGVGMKEKNMPKRLDTSTRFASFEELKRRRKREQVIEKKMRQDFNHDFKL